MAIDLDTVEGGPALIEFPGEEAMAARLADLIEAQLRAGLASKKRATFAVSGGSSPKRLYQRITVKA